jgi:CHAT domain-containing protein
VVSDAAVALTVFAARELNAAPDVGRAEALRRAMITVMEGRHPDGKKRALFAHPVFWAPFVNVGEGTRR